jgi:hypothetical protein
LFFSVAGLTRTTPPTTTTTDEWLRTRNKTRRRPEPPPKKQKKQGLRVHDNPALLDACRDASHVFPIFVLDPHFVSSGLYR